MDEWSRRATGNTMPGDQPGGFQHAMEQALFGPLGSSRCRRASAISPRKTNLPTYAEQDRAN